MITEFKGRHAYLSNFYTATVGLNTELFPTVEHAYQAAKTVIESQRLAIRDAKTPGIAKRMGKLVTLRDDWEGIKEQVMLDLLRQKFAPGTQLAQVLVQTGDERLIEGNTWGDEYWGMCYRNGQWVGRNRLGNLLMQVRTELRISELVA